MRPRALFPAESATGVTIAAPLNAAPGESTSVEDRIEAVGGAGRENHEGADVKLQMIWELLHDPQWQLPSSDVEAHWKDALGESAVMQVQLLLKPSDSGQALQSIILAGIGHESGSSTQHQRHRFNIWFDSLDNFVSNHTR